jgi:hypothetical protein
MEALTEQADLLQSNNGRGSTINRALDGSTWLKASAFLSLQKN